MSQYGARGYAEAGWGYERILAHYYRRTELTIVPARPVRVLLLEGKPSGQDRLDEAVQGRRRARQGAQDQAGQQNLVAAKIAAAPPAASLPAGSRAAPSSTATPTGGR